MQANWIKLIQDTIMTSNHFIIFYWYKLMILLIYESPDNFACGNTGVMLAVDTKDYNRPLDGSKLLFWTVSAIQRTYSPYIK